MNAYVRRAKRRPKPLVARCPLKLTQIERSAMGSRERSTSPGAFTRYEWPRPRYVQFIAEMCPNCTVWGGLTSFGPGTPSRGREIDSLVHVRADMICAGSVAVGNVSHCLSNERRPAVEVDCVAGGDELVAGRQVDDTGCSEHKTNAVSDVLRVELWGC